MHKPEICLRNLALSEDCVFAILKHACRGKGVEAVREPEFHVDLFCGITSLSWEV